MKRFLLPSLALVLLTSVAHSADIPAPVYRAPVVAPVFNWSGFYIGGNLGGAWSNSSITYNPTGVQWGTGHSGFIGGGQVGYNWQTGGFVLGVEADFDWTGINRTGNGILVGPFGVLTGSVNTQWASTIAGRFGYAWDRSLFYTKLGGGWVQNRGRITNAAGTELWSSSNTIGGWLVGAGYEYAFDRNWSVKLEYNYLAAPDRTVGPVLTAVDSVTIQRSLQMVKLGVNYRFGWGAW